MNSNHPILSLAEAYFKSEVVPQSAKIDQNSQALSDALKGMGKNRLLALKVPQPWGAGLDNLTYHRFQVLIARYSGALAFLQTQHQSAASQLSASDNEDLKRAYLPKLATGEVLIGVGFSQLRRQGPPLMQAIPVKDGYQLTGTVPWITGAGFFDQFILGATLPNGDELFALMPLATLQQPLGGSLQLSDPLELAVMGTTHTVAATIDHWSLSSDRILAIKPSGTIQQNDRKNVLNHGFWAIGCAKAGLDILENAFAVKKLSVIQTAWRSLNAEWQTCYEKMLQGATSDRLSFEERLRLRAWAIHLGGKCAQAAVSASSGAANALSHSAQRVYREALMFTVFGQTTAVMEATLKQLIAESH